MTENVKINRGLKGVYFERCGVSDIDGAAGELSYRGYSIHDLATQSTFEEVCFLLIHGELPTATELQDFRMSIRRHSMLHEDNSGETILYRGRIGPIREVIQYDILVEELENIGIFDPYLVTD